MASRGMPVTHQIREERRKRAEARQAEYDKLTLQQKIDRLPANGAVKQRAKLEAQLNKQAAKPAVEETAQASEKPAKQSKKGNEQ